MTALTDVKKSPAARRRRKRKADDLESVRALLIWRNRRDFEDNSEQTRQHFESAIAQARESLAAYKLEVAKSYTSFAYIKDVERRLTSHLVRIENKLDAAGGMTVGGRG